MNTFESLTPGQANVKIPAGAPVAETDKTLPPIHYSFGYRKCQYCETTYCDIHHYTYHLKVKRSCRKIRQALGLPVEIKQWACKKCGKVYCSRDHCQDHQWKCGKGMELETKQFDENGICVKPFKISNKDEDVEVCSETLKGQQKAQNQS